MNEKMDPGMYEEHAFLFNDRFSLAMFDDGAE